MPALLFYKNYTGSYSYSEEDSCFHGKIENINGLVTFESDTLIGIEVSFREAVEDFINLKQELL